MDFGKLVRNSILSSALASLFVIGGMAQPVCAAPRYAAHREIRNGMRNARRNDARLDRHGIRRDVRMRNRMNRRIARNLRQLRRSNREFGRNSLRSRMLRRRLRRNLRERYAMNRDVRQGPRDTQGRAGRFQQSI